MTNGTVPRSNAWPGGPDEYDTLACVNWDWDPFIGYVGGYAKAGRILVDYLASTGRSQDFLVYPIVFTYRHVLEIALKQVILGAGRLLEERDDHPDGHRLESLWKVCKPLLGRAFSDDREALDKIQSAVIRLDQLDPTGEAFRYPRSSRRNGRAPTMIAEIRHFPLGYFADEMDEILELLQAADTGIDVYLDYKADADRERAEMAAEMRAEMVEYYTPEPNEHGW